MQSQLILIPTITVHPHHISYYKQIVWDPKRNSTRDEISQEMKEYRKHEHLLTSNRTAEGKVSQTAKRKITKAIDYLLLFASEKKVTARLTGRSFKFKIAFITLTLPSAQIHDDNQIKRDCLTSFLIELRKYHHVKNYVWRAEKQKNGNIHFHIILDKYIDWSEIRDRWNRIINKLGYVDRYREKIKEFYKEGFQVRKDLVHKWPKNKQLISYNRNLKTDFNSPNSTDIHSIKKIINIKNYLIKYMSKNEMDDPRRASKELEEIKQKGRIWGASRNLENLKGAQMVLDWELADELQEIIDSTGCKCYDSNYFSVFYIDFPALQVNGNSKIFDEFCKYLNNEFDYQYQKELDL